MFIHYACYLLRFFWGPSVGGGASWHARHLNFGQPSRLPLILDLEHKGIESLSQISDWLQLSGSLPLAFYIFNYRETEPALQEIYDPVIDVLNRHSGRWHKVVLHLPPPFLNRFCGTSPLQSLGSSTH